ncbi:MAG: TonB-dependent receptor [Robiginitomaculum sp.]|nr:MAG: TonB-dependent receptor [Robiginitomaculum sp.]
MNTFRKSTLWTKSLATASIGALLAAGLAMPAVAQIDEIIVTATKKDESLQEVGMAVTAVQAQTLERMGAVSFADFAVRVPNLGFGNESDGRFNANSPSIRGVFGDNTTGFYIDDTPMPASIQPRVIDVERVEVLRGPQGSLYGARSMGGTIRLITKQPDLNAESVSGDLHATLSTVKEGDMNWSVDGSIDVPMVKDKLAARVTAYYGQNSGIFDREYIPTYVNPVTNAVVNNPGPAFPLNENVDDERYFGFQVVAKARLNENLTFTPKLMYQKTEADGLPFADISPGNFTERRFFDSEEPGSDRWWLGSGTFNWDVAGGSVVSTTSYFDRFIAEKEEETHFLHFLYGVVIGLPIDPLESVLDENERFKSFVHETRYSSNFDGKFNFTAGIYYQRNKNRLRYDPPALQVGVNAALNVAAGGPANIVPGDLIFETDNRFDTTEYAVFGEFTYDFSDMISVTAGGRFYDTTTDFAVTSDGFANGGPSQFSGVQKENGFNPKILVQARPSEDLNLYASASQGFRIGGVNGNVPAGPGELCEADVNALGVTPPAGFDSDTLWSYEAGFKSKMANNRFSINGAAYFIDWSNIIQRNRLACGFQFDANAGSAEIKGFEIEVVFAPFDGLTLNGSVGHADTEITDAGAFPGIVTGARIQGVPDWTFTASGEYIFPLGGLGDGMDGLLRADFNHYGDSFSSNNEPTTPRLRPKWRELNMRAGVIRDNWEIALFIDNVFNESINLADSRSIAAETPGRQRIVTNRPRTIGLDVRTRF